MLKNKKTGNVFFVVVFALLNKEDFEKEEAAINGRDKKDDGMADEFEPNQDDLD